VAEINLFSYTHSQINWGSTLSLAPPVAGWYPLARPNKLFLLVGRPWFSSGGFGLILHYMHKIVHVQIAWLLMQYLYFLFKSVFTSSEKWGNLILYAQILLSISGWCVGWLPEDNVCSHRWTVQVSVRGTDRSVPCFLSRRHFIKFFFTKFSKYNVNGYNSCEY
jgi:hypothetical protein